MLNVDVGIDCSARKKRTGAAVPNQYRKTVQQRMISQLSGKYIERNHTILWDTL